MLTRRYFVDLQANYVTVTWDAQGGTASESSRQVIKGQPIGALPTWSRDGYTFNGWFTAASDGSQINESTIVNDDVTYYAQSKQNISVVPSYGALTNRMLYQRAINGAELYGSRILATFNVTGTGVRYFSVKGIINGSETEGRFTDSTYYTSSMGDYRLSCYYYVDESQLKAMSGQWGIFFINEKGTLTKLNIYNNDTDELINSTTVNYTLA